jgi:hypothetical protein
MDDTAVTKLVSCAMKMDSVGHVCHVLTTERNKNVFDIF